MFFAIFEEQNASASPIPKIVNHFLVTPTPILQHAKTQNVLRKNVYLSGKMDQ